MGTATATGEVRLTIDGTQTMVPVGTTVAAAIARAGLFCRRSVTGEARTALCGMGICFECRVTIDGEAHQRSCQLFCEEGMDVRTDG